MKYKKSLYTIDFTEIIDQEEHFFLYNTYTSALAALDEKTYMAYAADDLDTETCSIDMSELINNGFIVELDRNELDEILVNEKIARYSNHILGLAIAPTMNCNMQCDYCFEEKQNIHMSEEIEKGVISFITKKVEEEKITTIDLTWYGGEPLLTTDVIYRLSEKVLKICADKDILFDGSMITNGYYLTYDTAKKLQSECKINQVQITVDGTEEMHNSRRITKDKSNGFKTIIENVKNICDFMRVVIRINIDKRNVENIPALLDFLMKEQQLQGKISIGFSPVLGENSYFYGQKEFSDIECKLWQYMFEHHYMRADEMKFTALDAGCTANGVNYFVIDPSGYLYTCWNNVGIKQLNIGNVFEGEKYNTNYCKWLLLEPTDKCKRCIYLPLCQGGCPYSLVHKGTERCDHTVTRLTDYLKLICKAMMDKEEIN